MRNLAATVLLIQLAACGWGQSRSLASYEMNGSVDRVAAKIAAMASAHSSLSRIDARRPPLRVQSAIRDGRGEVTIAVSGGAGQRDALLNFKLTPESEGKRTTAVLTMDAPDLGELDLGTDRFAGRKSLGREFGEALGALADKVNHPGNPDQQPQKFERLFDLAAVLDDPALLARVKARGKQEGVVDFLFAHPPAPREDED